MAARARGRNLGGGELGRRLGVPARARGELGRPDGELDGVGGGRNFGSLAALLSSNGLRCRGVSHAPGCRFGFITPTL